MLLPKEERQQQEEQEEGGTSSRKFIKGDVIDIANLFAPRERTKVKKLLHYLLKHQPFEITDRGMMVFPPQDTDPLEANRVFAAQSSLREMIQYMLNSSRTKSKNIEELKQPIDYDLFLSKIMIGIIVGFEGRKRQLPLLSRIITEIAINLRRINNG